MNRAAKESLTEWEEMCVHWGKGIQAERTANVKALDSCYVWDAARPLGWLEGDERRRKQMGSRESGRVGCWFSFLTGDHNRHSFLSLDIIMRLWLCMLGKKCVLNFSSYILKYLWMGWDDVWDLLHNNTGWGKWMGMWKEQLWPWVVRCGGWVVCTWMSANFEHTQKVHLENL